MSSVTIFGIMLFAVIFILIMIFSEGIEDHNGRVRHRQYKAFIDARDKDLSSRMNDKRAENKVKESHRKEPSDSDIEKLRQSFSDEEVEEIVELLFATDEFDKVDKQGF